VHFMAVGTSFRHSSICMPTRLALSMTLSMKFRMHLHVVGASLLVKSDREVASIAMVSIKVYVRRQMVGDVIALVVLFPAIVPPTGEVHFLSLASITNMLFTYMVLR
jgi:anti-sigma factor RsiW